MCHLVLMTLIGGAGKSPANSDGSTAPAREEAVFILWHRDKPPKHGRSRFPKGVEMAYTVHWNKITNILSRYSKHHFVS